MWTTAGSHSGGVTPASTVTQEPAAEMVNTFQTNTVSQMNPVWGRYNGSGGGNAGNSAGPAGKESYADQRGGAMGGQGY